MRDRRKSDGLERPTSPTASPPSRLAEALDAVAALPDEVGGLPVVVIGRERDGFVKKLRLNSPDHAFRFTAASPRLHLRLAGMGPLAAIIDLRADRRWRAQLAGTFFFVARGGRYLLWVPPDEPKRHSALADFVGAVSRGDYTTAPHVPPMSKQSTAQRDLRHLADALHHPHLGSHFLVATQGVASAVKLHDDIYDAVAARRGLPSALLATKPAQELRASGAVTFNRPHPLNPLHDRIKAPAVHLRAHDDVVCMAKQVVLQDQLVLPATFRRPTVARLRNTALTDLAPQFVRQPTPTDLATKRGTFYHLDSEIPGHFGHAVTELASRLWGWRLARTTYPDIKVLLAAPTRGDLSGWFYDLLGAAGIGRNDIETFHTPVKVERLVTASAMYSIGDFVHPDLLATYDELGHRLQSTANPGPYPRRVFFTRASERRGCRNQSDVEALFAEQGFHIVQPETLSLANQVAHVRRADVIAGFAGSNMLHLGLCGAPKRVLVITSDTYHVHNEHLLSALAGHHLDLIVCPADVPRPTDRFDAEAYRSTFAVNMDHEGQYLQELLGSI